jgi:hypothetical protein
MDGPGDSQSSVAEAPWDSSDLNNTLMLYSVESMSTATRRCFCFDYSLGCFPSNQVKSIVDITRSRWLLSARLNQTTKSIPIQATLHHRPREKSGSKQIRTIHILALLHGLVRSRTTKPVFPWDAVGEEKARNMTFHDPTNFSDIEPVRGLIPRSALASVSLVPKGRVCTWSEEAEAKALPRCDDCKDRHKSCKDTVMWHIHSLRHYGFKEQD